MLRMHVFLIDPYVGQSDSRAFSHPEYLHFFQGRALGELLSVAHTDGYLRPLQRFLNAGQLPDTVAAHAASASRHGALRAADAVRLILGTLADTWKASNIQVSAGKLVPKLLD